jgi:hypothetical protein
MLAPAIPDVVKQHRDRNKPAVFSRETIYQLIKTSIHVTASILKSKTEMSVHDASATFGFEPILISFRYSPNKSIYLRPLGGGEPLTNVAPIRIVVWHVRENIKRIYVGRCEVANVFNVLSANVSPKIGTLLPMTHRNALVLASCD